MHCSASALSSSALTTESVIIRTFTQLEGRADFSKERTDRHFLRIQAPRKGIVYFWLDEPVCNRPKEEQPREDRPELSLGVLAVIVNSVRTDGK